MNVSKYCQLKLVMEAHISFSWIQTVMQSIARSVDILLTKVPLTYRVWAVFLKQRIYDSTPAYEEKIIKVTLFLQILRFQMFGNQLPVVVMLLLLHRICILDLHEISIQNELSEWFVRRTFCCENVMNISWFKFKATINLKYQVLLWCIKTIHHNC